MMTLIIEHLLPFWSPPINTETMGKECFQQFAYAPNGPNKKHRPPGASEAKSLLRWLILLCFSPRHTALFREFSFSLFNLQPFGAVRRADSLCTSFFVFILPHPILSKSGSVEMLRSPKGMRKVLMKFNQKFPNFDPSFGASFLLLSFSFTLSLSLSLMAQGTSRDNYPHCSLKLRK